MIRRKVFFCVLTILALATIGWLLFRPDPFHSKYLKLRDGMTREQVEALLGPGSPIQTNEMPGIVVPINPADQKVIAEKARSEGTVPTAWGVPTRVKPAVEGDVVLIWRGPNNDQKIFVAFKNGLLCEKYYFEYDL
jgi:hypothetical protein